MRRSGIVLVLFVAVSLSTAVFAGPTTVVDQKPGPAFYIREGSPCNYTHDIRGESCYDPGFTITSAELELQFVDSYDGPNGSQPEYVTVWYDGFSCDLGEVDTGTYSVPVNPITLGDGLLGVQISVLDPGPGYAYVRLECAKLVVYADDTPCSPGATVPAPQAVVLAGLGAVLVGWVRRRKAL